MLVLIARAIVVTGRHIYLSNLNGGIYAGRERLKTNIEVTYLSFTDTVSYVNGEKEKKSRNEQRASEKYSRRTSYFFCFRII